MSWRARARVVSSLLRSAWPAFAIAARSPNRTAVTDPPTGARRSRRGIVTEPDCKRYRYRQASAPGREGRVAETTVAFTELLGRRVRMGPWEDQKISTY